MVISAMRRAFVTAKEQDNPKRILFLAAFFPENAGYQWRVNKWKSHLEDRGFEVVIESAISEKEFYELTQSNMTKFMIRFLKRRFKQVVASKKFDRVIVRRELLLYNDYGNLFLDKLLLKIHPSAILDFDDDIAYAKKEPREINSLFAKLLREHPQKFTESLRLYKRFTVGSNYLKEFVLERNPTVAKEDVHVLPTCLDYDFELKSYPTDNQKTTFGWIGGDHNQRLLEHVIPTLNTLSEKSDLELLVISRTPYTNENARFPIRNYAWSLETEVLDLKRIDIGLMPLNNTNEDKGKAGFKLLQYMALGIVSVASGITVNKDIVDEGTNGFLVDPNGDWFEILSNVLNQKNRFVEIGQQARKKIEKNYLFRSQANQYIDFLRGQTKNQ